MSTEYREAQVGVIGLMESLINEHFGNILILNNLVEDGLRFEVLMAASYDGKAPLKKEGHEVAFAVKAVGAEERATGGPDVRIKINQHVWDTESETGQKALLFSALHSIRPKYHKKLCILRTDDYKRPELFIHKGDWLCTGFVRTVEVFGDAALERRALTKVEEVLKQKVFGFVEDRPAEAQEAISLQEKVEAMMDRFEGAKRPKEPRTPKPKTSAKSKPKAKRKAPVAAKAADEFAVASV